MHRCLPHELPLPGFLLLGLAVLGLASAWAPATFAHEPIHTDIDRISAALHAAPDSAQLYLHRAELYRLAGHWQEAMADLQSAGERGADPVSLGLCRAALHLDMGDPRKALDVLDELIATGAFHEPAHLLRSQARLATGERSGAIADLDVALAKAAEPHPETYLQRCRLILEGDSADRERALTGLEDGIARLGPVVSLVFPAVELDVELGRYDSALARLEVLESQFDLESPLLVRRAEVLEEAGRVMEAQAAYTEALERIEGLPREQRNSARVQSLERRIRSALRAGDAAAIGEMGE